MVGAGFKYTPDSAIWMNYSGGPCHQLRVQIYILWQNLSIVDPFGGAKPHL